MAALEAEGVPCDGLFCEPVYRSTLFEVDPAEFPAFEESVWLPHRLLLGSEEDVDSVVAAIEKIRSNVDELRTAEHRLVRLKSLSRTHRDRAIALGL